MALGPTKTHSRWAGIVETSTPHHLRTMDSLGIAILHSSSRCHTMLAIRITVAINRVVVAEVTIRVDRYHRLVDRDLLR